MRHTKDELIELFSPLAQNFQDCVYAGCEAAAATHKHLGTLRKDRRALYSHAVRAGAFDYLSKNPIKGFTLEHREHPLNQAVALREDASGLVARLVRLKSWSAVKDVPLTGIEEDPAVQQAIAGLELQFQEPGVVGISWETPNLDEEGLPTEAISITAVRAAPGTKLKDGRADLIFPLVSESEIIPARGFDPNATEFSFELEKDQEDERQG